jgi:hypothetical protein
MTTIAPETIAAAVLLAAKCDTVAWNVVVRIDGVGDRRFIRFAPNRDHLIATMRRALVEEIEILTVEPLS